MNEQQDNDIDKNNTSSFLLLLADLLAALSSGVSSSSRLPLHDDYDFEFLCALPEVKSDLENVQSELVQLLSETLRHVQQIENENHTTIDDVDDAHLQPYIDLDDAALWERCTDACEYLLERASSFLEQPDQESNIASHGDSSSSNNQLLLLHRMQQMVHGTDMDMPKPQLQWKHQHDYVIDNGRTKVFVPAIRVKPHAIVPLHLELLQGHGLETRWGSLRSRNAVAISENLVAPSHHVAHVYEAEIKALQYSAEQLQATAPNAASESKQPDQDQENHVLTATWIDTLDGLKQFVANVNANETRVLAVDLEAHSHRSYSGITCLMQVSYKRNDNDNGNEQNDNDNEHNNQDNNNNNNNSSNICNALIDTLALRFELNEHLQPLFADPSIVKVFHGADSDIQWLQRDFGLYVVNLFDTGRAAAALGLPKKSYAYLLRHYVGIDADKSYQLADWRQRPLTPDMQQYAIQDTHYLLGIYERIKYDLAQKEDGLVNNVFDVSKQVSLIRYAGEPFDPDGYKSIWNQHQSRRGRQTVSSNVPIHVQEAVLKTLWDWRDRVARETDESLFYVCGKQPLLRIATAHTLPNTVRALQALFTKSPPVVLERADEILELIKEAASNVVELGTDNVAPDTGNDGDEEENVGAEDGGEEEEDEQEEELARQPVGAPSSAFDKPQHRGGIRPRGGRDSPVLATETLYRQAGWKTPEVSNAALINHGVVDVVTTTDDELTTDEHTNIVKPKGLLAVHLQNEQFASGQFSDHTLGVTQNGALNGDGLATAAAASQGKNVASLAEHSQRAKQLSGQIGSTLTLNGNLSAVLSMHAPTLDMEDAESEDEVRGRGSDGADTDVEEYPIPRSMREIYKISNRNRRHKKTGSPETTPTMSDKNKDELAKAEALLREQGLLDSPFFNDGSSKKQRTKATGRESEESVPDEEIDAAAERKADLAVLKEVGWMTHTDTDTAAAPPVVDKPHIGLLHNIATAADNPFFAGAALVGGPLAAQALGNKPKSANERVTTTTTSGRRTAANRRERPAKRDGKTFHYRKK
ncbi:hypothetical protein MPSEU_001104400 [Mayamaea pseudoterrestris]|nr:hypothetical protein MPSEU_001104400 [Mayamaea pseudoterrestris]